MSNEFISVKDFQSLILDQYLIKDDAIKFIKNSQYFETDSKVFIEGFKQGMIFAGLLAETKVEHHIL